MALRIRTMLRFNHGVQVELTRSVGASPRPLGPADIRHGALGEVEETTKHDNYAGTYRVHSYIAENRVNL